MKGWWEANWEITMRDLAYLFIAGLVIFGLVSALSAGTGCPNPLQDNPMQNNPEPICHLVGYGFAGAFVLFTIGGVGLVLGLLLQLGRGIITGRDV